MNKENPVLNDKSRPHVLTMNINSIKDATFKGTSIAARWVASNPKTTAAVGVGLTVVVAPAIVAGPLLAVGGFGEGGIIAGSAAAAVQSSIGNVVAPSLFSTLTSAGAGGYGVAAVHGVVQAAGGAAAAAAGLKNLAPGWLKSKL